MRIFPPDGDYGFLIGPAAQMVESELDRLLTSPARLIIEPLIRALHGDPRDRGSADLLDKWAAGRAPTTFGTHVAVLFGLQRGCQRREPTIEQFLAGRFDGRYLDLLRSQRLGPCLNVIRRDFRNPACHAESAFDLHHYEQFARLLVARRRLADWAAAGPEPTQPAADVGVFHHHLSLSLSARD